MKAGIYRTAYLLTTIGLGVTLTLFSNPAVALAGSADEDGQAAIAVHSEESVATIGDAGYPSIADAVKAVPENGSATTITLTDNVVMGSGDIVTIAEGKNVVLDMGGTADQPGFSITANEDFSGRPIMNYGTLSIRGFGTIDVSMANNGLGPIDNYGTLTIENGSFRGNLSANGANLWNRTGGTMTINGGRFDTNGTAIATQDGSNLTINGGYFESPWYPAVDNSGTAEINGGTFVNTSCSSCNRIRWGYTIRNGINSDGAYLCINNADVTGTQGGVAIVGGTADIYDGSFKTVDCKENHGAVYYALYVAGESYETSAKVYGGTFSSEKREAIHVGNNNAGGDGGECEDATLEVYGGTFSGGAGVDDKTAVMVDGQLGGLAIYGGTYSSDKCKGSSGEKYNLSSHVASGFELSGTDEGGFSANAPKGVAQIGNRVYPSLQTAIDSLGATAGKVTVIADTTESFRIDSDQTITLDLNGRTVTTTSVIVVEGDLTIVDGTATTDPQVSDDFESVTYESGTIKGESNVIQAQNGGTITLKSGTVHSTSGNGMNVLGNTDPDSDSVVSSINIEGGYVHSREYGIGVYGTVGMLNVSGGVIVADDNGAIAGNGTVSESNNQGGTDINVSGGMVIGHIVTSGYIAMGIYHPQAGTLDITGGTIYADGGAGIVMRAGKLNLSGDARVIATGDAKGCGGDSKYELPSAGIIYDVAAGYPGMDKGDNAIVVTDGMVSSASFESVHVIMAETPTENFTTDISGGTFSTSPLEYLASGHVVRVNSDGTYSPVERKNLPAGSYQVPAGQPEITSVDLWPGLSVIKNDDGTYTVVRPSVPSTPSEPAYAVTVEQSDGGKVTVSPSRVEEGDVVTVTATPDEGKLAWSVTVTDEDGNAVEVERGEKDGTWTFEMPKGDVTVAVRFVCDGKTDCSSSGLVDVEVGAWYHDVVDWAVETGAMTGHADGTGRFAPDAALTRAQLAAVLYRAAGEPSADVSGLSAYSDCDEGAWYAESVAWVTSEGLMTGYDDGTGRFAPDAELTREQLAAVYWRFAGEPAVDADLSAFPDGSETSTWATDPVEWAVSTGLLRGNDQTGELDPTGDLTRAQMAAVLYRLANE